MNSLTFLLTYLGVINAIGLILMGIDKRKARVGAFRVPELTLFTIAVIGGSLGSLIGMHVFRHKTRVLHFKIGMPLILFLHVALALYLFFQPIPIRFL